MQNQYQRPFREYAPSAHHARSLEAIRFDIETIQAAARAHSLGNRKRSAFDLASVPLVVVIIVAAPIIAGAVILAFIGIGLFRAML